MNTFKNHVIAGLCSVAADFHLQLWYRMIQQAKIKINLLRKSQLHPHLSAYTHIYKDSYYNQILKAILGTKVVIKNRPKVRTLWDPHG